VTGDGFEGKCAGTMYPTSLNHEAFSDGQRMPRNAEDSVAGGQSFELEVQYPSGKLNFEMPLQRNLPQNPRSRLRGGQTQGTHARHLGGTSRQSPTTREFVSRVQTVWRRGRDLNSRMGYPISGFQDRHVRPLRHPSVQKNHQVSMVKRQEYEKKHTAE
jgi:hypothetical protein